MVTRKQEILNELLYRGLLYLRTTCWQGENSSRWLDHRERFRRGACVADFLHNIKLSIFEPEFTENDLSFIDIAFPIYIKQMGDHLDSIQASLMLELYDLVPEFQRDEVTWNPSDDFRALASKWPRP